MESEKQDYNCYSINTIKNTYDLGVKFNEKYADEDNLEFSYKELYRYELPEYPLQLAAFFKAGFYKEKIDFEPKTWFRIGEPRVCWEGNYYEHSHNFAEDRAERGVSVISSEWLHSFKSVFFGAHDNDKLCARGIYKIKGILVGTGGDGEPVIYPTSWAEKTKIRSFLGLEKAVIKLEEIQNKQTQVKEKKPSVLGEISKLTAEQQKTQQTHRQELAQKKSHQVDL